MADQTVTPNVLTATATLRTPNLQYDYTVIPGALTMALVLRPRVIQVSFPTLARSPGHQGYSELMSEDAVLHGRSESGYPVANKQFTFDPCTWQFSLYSVSQADKEVVMAFYENHKDIPFDWYNKQDGITYEVMFSTYPECRIMGRIDLWQINLVLVQTSPL